MLSKKLTRVANFVLITSSIASLTGCSSIVSHTGGNQGYYLGTKANHEMITNSNTEWTVKSLAIADYPFSLAMDTLMLPWDYFRRQNSVQGSLRSRVLASENSSSADNMPPRYHH